jgi:LCP family protein required for cell wall assembly
MSDGDSATPGSGIDGARTRLTRTPRPSAAAAPWERAPRSASGRRSVSGEPAVTGEAAVAGEATGAGEAIVAKGAAVPHDANRGVSVAALLAKVSAEAPGDLPSSRAADDDEAWLNADTIPTPSAYASELPDLEAARQRSESSGLLPPESGDEASTASPQPEPKPTRRPMLVLGRIAAALIAMLALAVTGGAWHWSATKSNHLNKVAALDPQSHDIINPEAQLGDENFLIVGVDSRTGANADLGAGTTADADGSRSDTVMLVNIPASRKRVVVVSFPRDLAITPLECDSWDNNTGAYGTDEVYSTTKLNSAYAVGGPKCAVKIIQKLSGLNINHFIAADMAGFAKMVDALGGVEVCSTTPLQDYELGTVLANAGRQMIDGRTALNYVRARQVTTEFNGDYGRIKRQQLFLSSLLRAMISDDVLLDPGKLNNVVNMFVDNTSVDNVTTKDLVELGQSLQGVSAGRITFLTVPTTGITDENGDEPPRLDDIRTIFDAIINDDPLPDEKAIDPPPAPEPASPADPPPAVPPAAAGTGELVDAVTTAPQDVTVQVSNSTDKTGLATNAAAELQAHGFNVQLPDDYPALLPVTTVYFSSGNEQAAATVASAFAAPDIERISGLADAVHVVIGSDFNTVNAPSPAGSAVRVHVNHATEIDPPQLPEDLTVTNAADTTCQTSPASSSAQ